MYLQLSGPKVQPTSSGESRTDLSHTQANKHDKEGDQQPAPDDGDGTSCGHSEPEQGHDSDQHRRVCQSESKVLKTRKLASMF